ncbi:MAG: hypothetical protein ACPKPY_13060 [Nitrososphaeraceae archaeon]
MINYYVYNCNKKNFANFLKVLYALPVIILFFSSIEDAWSQEEIISKNDTSNKSKLADNIYNLSVTFESIKINNDHDILFPGEWKIDVYVNDKKIQLLPIIPHVTKVESGQVISFDNKKEIKLNLTSNQTLKIMAIGVEFDNISDYKINELPNFSGIIKKDSKLSEYRNKMVDGIQYLISLDRNDAIGVLAKEFTVENNFGRGSHNDCSEQNGEPGDLYDTIDTNCDFRLKYNIR